MKTSKFRSTQQQQGFVTEHYANAPLGMRGTSIVYEVTEIPDEVSLAQVAMKLTNTCTYISETKGRYSFKFSELGDGVILR